MGSETATETCWECGGTGQYGYRPCLRCVAGRIPVSLRDNTRDEVDELVEQYQENARLLKEDNERLRAALMFFALRSTWIYGIHARGYSCRGSQPWRVATKALGFDEVLEGAAVPSSLQTYDEARAALATTKGSSNG